MDTFNTSTNTKQIQLSIKTNNDDNLTNNNNSNNSSNNNNNSSSNNLIIINSKINNNLIKEGNDNDYEKKFRRRECKSSSDETFEFDLNLNKNHFIITNSLLLHQIEPNNDFMNAINNTNTSNNVENGNNLSNSIIGSDKLNVNCGKFGYNASIIKSLNISPSSFGKIKSSKERRHKRVISNQQLTDRKHSFKTKLIQAVTTNDYHTVLDLLQSSNVDVNCCDDKQRTPLHIASSKGNVDIVRVLLDFGANPNMRDCVCNLPIHLAIIGSHVPIVTILLEAGTDIHSLDIHGKTVLHLAGTRLRWLLNDDNHKASPKLKLEAIQIMNMIKEYLKRRKEPTVELDILSKKFENVFSIDDINNLTNELLNKFETITIA